MGQGLDDYGTHFPILAAAVAETDGTVLELGVGHYSTPLLHYLCRRRMLVSADADEAWLNRFSDYESESHEFHFVRDWKRWIPDCARREWGVIFVDCAPGEIRHWVLDTLRDCATYLVAHDSERDYDTGANYEYEKVKPLFKHVSEWRRYRPYTLVLSNERPFAIEECDRIWNPASACS